MAKLVKWAAGAAVVTLAGILVLPAIAGPGSDATIRFGNPTTGTEFDPGTHDASFNAQDNVIPRTAVISAGGTVTFDVQGFHWPVIYGPGTKPSDIAVPAFPPESNIFIDDFGNSDFVGAAPGPVSWTSPALTQPGKYLMICNVTPHFAFAKMYGTIIVK